jgi:hypothetical protein
MSKNDLQFPLPRRAKPSACEDLLSLLRRTAHTMGYEDPHWILHPQKSEYALKERDIALLSKAEDYRFLSQLLFLSEETIYQHTLHRFASFFEENAYQDLLSDWPKPQQRPPDERMLLSRQSQKLYFLAGRFLRVCPLCLQEGDPYDRLYWRIRLIRHCPLHRLPLRETCPNCQAPIPALRVSPFTCPKCKQGDYRTPTAVPLASESLPYLSELFLLKALALPLDAYEASRDSLASSPLSALAGTSYVRLLSEIRSRLGAAFSLEELLLFAIKLEMLSFEDATGEGLAGQQDLAMETVTFLFFHWLFLMWPSHLFAFLDLLYGVSSPPFMGEQHARVSAYSARLFDDAREPWLQQAYRCHLQQFRYDARRTQDLRVAMHTLACSFHAQYATAGNSSTQEDSGARPDARMLILPLAPSTPTPSYLWESLESVVSRAASKMHYPNPERLFSRPAFTPRHFQLQTSELLSFSQEADDRFFAYLLHLDPEKIPHLTCDPLIQALRLKSYGRSGRAVCLTERALFFWLSRSGRSTKVCPRCLEDSEEHEAYDRLYWQIPGVLICPRHRLRLLERCPVCLQEISAFRPTVRACASCGTDLSSPSQRQSIAETSLHATGTSLLLTMLQLPSSEAGSFYTHLASSPLLTLTPYEYFALLVELSQELHAYFSDQELMHLCQALSDPIGDERVQERDVSVWDSEVVLFHTLFLDWPTRFFAFLDLLYRSVRWPSHLFDAIVHRWRWLLSIKWSFIAPSWLFEAYKEHASQFYDSDWCKQQQLQELRSRTFSLRLHPEE